MNYSLSVLILGLLLCACVNTKKTTAVWIPRHQFYYERTNAIIGDLNPIDSIQTKRLTQGAKARITLPTLPTDVFAIKFLESMNQKFRIENARQATDKDPAISGSYVPGSVSVPSGTSADQTFQSDKFRFIEYRPVFQTLTLPLKYRPGIRDTIKSTAAASFNVGFAYAFKFTSNAFRKIYWNNNNAATPLANHVTKWTYAFGPFAGPTIIDLKVGNTDGNIAKDRTMIGLTYGAFGVVGYNDLNIGLAAGWNQAFGTEGKAWIYSGKPWIGFVVAIDIIK